MYAAVADPYCYRGTTVLKNIPALRDQAALDAFEAAMTTQRSDEPLPRGRLSVSHYRAIHRHLFQDTYRWAGRYRTVRLSKGQSVFCYPENIPQQMTALFADLRDNAYFVGLEAGDFAEKAAHVLTTLNAVHPFREGNGRTQLIFITLLASDADWPLDLLRLVPDRFLAAMIRGFYGNERALARELRSLIA